MLSLTSRQGPRPASQNRKLLMFGSNDYLSLAGDEDVVQAGVAAMLRFGTGVAMNQPFATTPLHDELRQRIAAFTGTEAALLFGSCTAANIALLTTLARESDAVILSDANNHASIIDGCRLARGRSLVYRTRDIVDLARQLDRLAPGLAVTVVSDGVFSVEGDIAPAAELARLARKAGAALVLDESHAAGVVGPGGRGTAEACGLDPRRDVTAFTGTFAKAFGAGGGGYIAGSAELMAEIQRMARFYIFNTGMHVAAVGSAIAGVEQASGDNERRVRLRHNTARLRRRLSAAGFVLLGGQTPITPVLVGEESAARNFGQRLDASGVIAPVMAFPIVPQGGARLRLQPCAGHSDADIDQACDVMAEAARTLGLIG